MAGVDTIRNEGVLGRTGSLRITFLGWVMVLAILRTLFTTGDDPEFHHEYHHRQLVNINVLHQPKFSTELSEIY